MDHSTAIISAIDNSLLNRGLPGADWLETPGNIPVVMPSTTGLDIALFDYEGDGVYQVHFLFDSRGREALDAARESFRRMFENHGANLIMGLVPEHRKDVSLLARWAGGKFVGLRDTAYGLCKLFVLSRDMWSK